MPFMIDDVDALPRQLAAHAQEQPWPQAHDRAAWLGLGEQRRRIITDQAMAAESVGWPALTACAHRACARCGDRLAYERPYFARRQALNWWLLAACCEPEQTLIDRCVDAIWSLCEESTWCLPAHSGQDLAERSPLELPQPAGQFIDLFSAETAAQLATACALLDDLLPAAVVVRVAHELHRRIFTPLALGRSYWWEHGLNNWTPWVASNLLHAGCWAESDGVRLAALVERLDVAVGRYCQRLSPDGGCDEGIGYWNVGCGRLLQFGERLALATGVVWHPSRYPALAAAARFPAVVHLGQGLFPTFADSLASVRPLRPVLARALRCCPDPGLADLLQWSLRGWRVEGAADPGFELGSSLAGGSLNLLLDQCFHCPEPDPAWRPQPPPASSWLPDLQWLCAQAGPLALAAKAGHNGENHNHNDVGQWCLYLDGAPVLIDVGRGSYGRESFLPGRYGIWYNGSQGHAVPQVAGQGQIAARRFDAAEAAVLLAGGQPTWEDRRIGAQAVHYSDDGQRLCLGMDLAACYPDSCGLRHLWRRLELDREDHCLLCQDQVEAAAPVEMALPLIAVVEPRLAADGLCLDTTSGAGLHLSWSGWQLQAVEPIDLENDPDLGASWGPRLWRIRLQAPAGETGQLRAQAFARCRSSGRR